MGNYLSLAIFFLAPFAGVLWIWWGVRIWQVGVIAIVFGVAYGAVAMLANSATDLAFSPIFGPGPEGWLARRLACAAGFASSGLVALALALPRHRKPGNDT